MLGGIIPYLSFKTDFIFIMFQIRVPTVRDRELHIQSCHHGCSVRIPLKRRFLGYS
jgi:hypothetical protein